MQIDFHSGDGRAAYRLLVGAVAPRPIAFVSTLGEDGRRNLAPFSYFNLVSTAPPVVVLSITKPGDRAMKDSLANLLATREAVVHIVSHGIVERMNLASVAYPSSVDEFVKSGLTPVPASRVKPLRVAEAPIAFECRLRQAVPLGNDRGAGTIVICDVCTMHIDERVLTADAASIDPDALDAVARMGDDWYCRASGGAVFRMPRIRTNAAIGVDALPDCVRSSSEWSMEELARYGLAEQVPTQDELNTFRERHAQMSRFDLTELARAHLANFQVWDALLAAICAGDACVTTEVEVCR